MYIKWYEFYFKQLTPKALMALFLISSLTYPAMGMEEEKIEKTRVHPTNLSITIETDTELSIEDNFFHTSPPEVLLSIFQNFNMQELQVIKCVSNWFNNLSYERFNNMNKSIKKTEPEHLNLALQIIEHTEKTLGTPLSTLSFNDFDIGSILTILIFEPTVGIDHYTLVTAGMSQTPTNDGEKLVGNELVLRLPKTWNPPEDENDLNNLAYNDFLPIEMLVKYAEFPLKHNRELGYGHTAKMGYDKFSHVWFNFTCFGADFEMMDLKESDKNKGLPEVILFLGMYPITKKEFKFRKKDSDECFGHLRAKGAIPVFDLSRKCTID